MSEEFTVFVVDDDEAVVDGLRSMLEAQGFRVEGFHSAAEFLRNYCLTKLGCLIVDVRMPGMSGLELQEHLRAKGAAIGVILITANGDVAMGVQAVKRGAVHFLEKPCRPGDLIKAVHEALDVCRRRAPQQQASAAFQQRLQQLTAEEFAAFKGTVAGQTNAEIAAQLDISLRTVQFRRVGMMQKLGVSSKQELMNLVFRAGWSPEREGPQP